MITIDGLTDKQVAMLDVMWSCETQEQLNDWKSYLTKQDQQMVDSLTILIQMEMIEEDVPCSNYNDAREVLSYLM